jgi:hypothetical protein
MSEAAARFREGEWLRIAGLAALVLCVGTATVAVAVAGANAALAVVPVAIVGALWGLAKAPLRVSAGTLLFLVLALEVSTDTAGLWHSPLAALGDLLQENLERSAGLPGVSLSGLEVVALYLLGVAAFQRRRPAVAVEGVAPAPRVVWGFLLVYVAAVAYAEANGLARGSGAATWKVRQLLDVPLLALVFQAAFRGPRDHRLLGRVVILAATIKALLAVYVQRVAAPALTGGKLDYATNHGDSVLFAIAAFILIAHVAERRDLRRAAIAAAFLPVILVGIHENGRRTAWVMLWMSLLAAYFVTPARPWKRVLTRAVLLAAPLLVLYAAVGWNRGGRLFAPIQTLRTLSDSSVDSSTRWREVENWNIAMSMREHPILGIGLGAEYTEFVKGDDISSAFADFKAWPHNSVLGLLLFAGPIAFTAMSALLGLVVFLSVRSHRLARSPEDRVAALTCIAAVISCSVLAYGDTGAHFAHYRVLLALAVAVSGKLAVATGAWPAPGRRTRGVTVGATGRRG